MDQELYFLGLVEAGKLIGEGKISAVELTEAILERITALDPTLKSYVRVLSQSALQEARRADRDLKRGSRRGPLHGVPVAVKDLCDMKGAPTTAGIPKFQNNIPKRDATVVRKLRAAGAVIIGKLQLTEGALALHHPDIEPPVNPWVANRWSGASSSGTGVAVAAGMAYGALGSDTGGSIRFPAFCNGVVGLKPTWSLVSRYGVVPLSETLDHIGPLTRSVEDAAAMLSAIAGHDSHDPTSSTRAVPNYLASIYRGVRSLRIGIDRAHACTKVDPAVKGAVERALRVLKKAGGVIVPFKMPKLDRAITAWGPMCSTEAALAHQETYPRRKRWYSATFGGFLAAGRGVTGLEYAQAEIIRRELRGEMDERFQSIDLMVKPVYAKLNPTHKAFTAQCAKEGGLNEIIRFTAPDDMTGYPTITLPAGWDKNGSPMAIQFVARPFEETLLFRAGRVWQNTADWRGKHPPLTTA